MVKANLASFSVTILLEKKIQSKLDGLALLGAELSWCNTNTQ